jgi:hypothetical protein
MRAAHDLSDAAYGALHMAPDPAQLYANALEGIGEFAGLVDQEMAADADELMWVGLALLGYLDAGVLVADVHEGNVGHVQRDGRDLVVITDPGHAAVLPSPWPR